MINRRTFNTAMGLGTGAAAVSLAGLQGVSHASGSTPDNGGKAPVVPSVTPGAHTSFPALKQIKAGLLNVGYAELGPAHGPAVICLHGW
ncbi:alpha/beta hydrolase, partial [Streptomyces sp. NPDC056121]